MLNRPLFVILAALWGVLDPLPAEAQTPAPSQAAVVWNVERRDFPLYNWRQKVAVGPDGTVWVGEGAPVNQMGGGLIHSRQGTTWTIHRIDGSRPLRTHVLDVDPEGRLWLAAFHPEPDNQHPFSPYNSDLRIQRFDGRTWSEEKAPGFWPQCMDMITAEEGWIGGNHGQFLHRSAGQWKLERLPGPAAQTDGRTIFALKMLSVEEGWAVGHRGLIAHRSRGRWKILQPPPALAKEDLFDVDVTAEDGHLWVVGTKGVIGRYDGKVWKEIHRPVDFDLRGLDMVSPTDGWTVGDFGILRYDGTGWALQRGPISGAVLGDVVMISPQEGWIVGGQAVLHARADSKTRQIPRFQDQSRWAGYPMARRSNMLSATLDVDGDGDLDLLSYGGGSINLYVREGPRRFIESSRFPLLVSSQESLGVFAWAWGDIEGDGDPDVALWGTPFGLQILRNSGRGVFTAAGKLPAADRPRESDALFLLDLDGDRQMDLALARRHGPPNRIYRNQGGSFQAARQEAPGEFRGLATLWGDLDGDRHLDAVLSGGAPSGNEPHLVVLRGDGAGGFHAPSRIKGLPLPWRYTVQGILVDVDRDGDLDMILLSDELAALINDGKGRFRRDRHLLPPVKNYPYSLNFLTSGDLNHDGYPELLVQTTQDFQTRLHLLARGPGERSYKDVTDGSGLESLWGVSAVFSDLDDDGDLDLYLSQSDASVVLENSQNDMNFLKVRLQGDRSNRAAAGAQVWIHAAGRRGRGSLRGYQQMGIGFSPTGQQSLSELHFGLDGGRDGRRPYDVEVLFPSGRRVVERKVVPGRTIEIFESPPGIRQAFLFVGWAQRAWLEASRPLELGKLAFVVLALAVWRGPLARRFETRLFVPRWSLAAGLLIVYLVLAGELADERTALPQASQVMGFCVLLTLLTGLDARLSRWKNQHFFGPFVLEKTLGQGGMGVVHRARHAVTGQVVALKVLHPQWIEREDLRLRFLREAQLLTRLDHPNIVRVYETGAVGDRGYISMELLKGMALGRYLQQKGPLAPEIVVELLLAACDALAHVHAAGLVHGDIKSANIFLLDPDDLAPAVQQGWRPRIKLMDFGLAQTIGTETLASLDGTPAYMPPEQLRRRPLDVRSDLYSLGVVGYEALTGRLPFAADGEGSLLLRIQSGEFIPVRQRNPEVPAALERALARTLALSPTDRPASAVELSGLLRALRPSGEPAAPPAATVLLSSSAAPPVGDAAWQTLFRQAKIGLAAGRITEGQVLLMESLAALGETLEQMSEEERDAYCRRHEEIAAALELNRRLSLSGAQP